MNKVAISSRGLIYGLLAFVIPLAVYLIWSPLDYSGDDLQQSIVIHRATYGGVFFHPSGGVFYEPDALSEADEPTGLPVQPRYLLEYPSSILMARLWQAAGWQDSVITPVLFLRALVGAAGILFLFLALRDLLGNALIALLGSLGLATTLAYWTYSTHVDQSINMMMFISLAFYALVRYRNSAPTLRGKFILALILAFASFYNFTAVLTVFGMGLGVALLPRDLGLGARVREFIIFGVFYAAIVLVTMVVMIAVLASPASLVDPVFWQEAIFAGKPEYNVDMLRDLMRAVIGLAKSQVVYPGVSDAFQEYWDSATQTQRLLLSAYFGAVLMLLALPVIILFLRRKRLQQRYIWLWATLGAMLLLHSAFNWFWDPGFIKYWLVPLFCLWVIAAVALNHLQQTASRLYQPAVALTVLVLVAAFALNFTTEFYPDSQPRLNPWSSIASDLKESSPSAFFISDGHPLDFHVAYFTRRNVISTELVNYALGGDAQESTLALVNEHITHHQTWDGDIYLYSDKDIEALVGQLGLTMDDVEIAWEYPDITIYQARFASSTLS